MHLKISQIFNDCFAQSHHVLLAGGCAEPLYQPAREHSPARIWYREDYASSALHEIAHWCIAGEKRLALEDYGYWYSPDGRTAHEQKAFEQAEVKPQALEWVFSRLIPLRFHLSADNLLAGSNSGYSFAGAVVLQAKTYLTLGLPVRACLFAEALQQHFATPWPLLREFSIEELV